MIFLHLARKSQWAVFHQHGEKYNYCFSVSVWYVDGSRAWHLFCRIFTQSFSIVDVL